METKFDPFSVPRPQYKWCDVITTLADFAIVTFAVNPANLARYLPPGFEPDVFTLADGTRTAFVSAVPFRDLDFRFACAPWARFTFGQTNYRAYVIYKGERCVWFFGTSLATPLVMIPRHLWQLPWHRAQMQFNTAWVDSTCTAYKLTTASGKADAHLDLAPSMAPCGTLDGFTSDDETSEILTHPLVGYFFRRDGKLGSYSVWHERLKLCRAEVRKAEFDLFVHLGLTTPGQPVHSALVQQTTEFVVQLPPFVVK